MSLFSHTTGQGPDLVLLHGWAMNGDVWEDIVPALAKDYRVTLVDLPGHGRSQDCPKDYTLTQLSAMLGEVMPPRAHLVGWSLGGMLASQFTLDFPQRVQSLILVASAPQFVRTDDWPDGVDPDVLTGFAAGLQQDYPQTLRRFIAIQALGSDHAREQQRSLRERVFRHGQPQPAALEGGLAILQHANLRPRLEEIRCPTAFIAGEHDALFRPAAARATCERLTQAALTVIPGAGHAPFLSHPAAFLAALKDSLP
ncbi:MAG TPA: pimeloyl-[acyl-carrier protein] methyl ester esterase [Gammaproteobacteria bacterium]|nr:pimeloyl-[acyl-carrier protein] methyl ester esterase [Gammaproteobacteria bacterium]